MPDPNPNETVNLSGSGTVPHVQRSDGKLVPQQGTDAGEAKVSIANLPANPPTSTKQDETLSVVQQVRDKFTDGTVDNNLGSAVSKTVKSGAGRLLSLSIRHADASAIYLWIFDNTTASGTLLIVPILVPANSHVIVGTDFFSAKGLAFSTGLTYGFSTSGSSYLAYGTTTNCFATVVYA